MDSQAGPSAGSDNRNPSSAGRQPGQPLKRACDQCNLRRVKCSHDHPCTHCVRLRIQCTYWKAARGKESSGKRIEKLRREQALAAAAAAGHGPSQGQSAGTQIYPLGTFAAQDSGPNASFASDSSVAGPSTLPLPPPSAQYAGPSAHFPNAPPIGEAQHAKQEPNVPVGSTFHRVPTPTSSTSQPSTSQQGTGHGATAPTHVPPATFLGNAFFPPSLTTISPSTAANFRLPDLSTSLADEFNAQDPNVRAAPHNFFDWGVGMLGGNGSAAGQQAGQAGVSASLDGRSAMATGPSSHLGSGSTDAFTPTSSSGAPFSTGTPASTAALAMPNASAQAPTGIGLTTPSAAPNARMNLYDWGLGMLASGTGFDASPSNSAGLSPHASISGGSGSGGALGSVDASRSATASLSAHVNAASGGGAGAARSRAVSYHGNMGDFALGLQQQQHQRMLQEQQLRQRQAAAAAAVPTDTQHVHGANANASTSAPTIPPQGHALPPSLQGVLPSTLEILGGSHPLSESVLLPHIGLYFERLHPIMPVFSRSWIFSKLDRGDQHTSVDFASMLLAMSALALIQPQEAKERASARMRVRKAKALLEESVRLRNAVLFAKTPTLESTMTSFYVFACLFGLGEDNPAWFRLHEAVALGLLLKLHEPKAYAGLQRDEQERRLRAYWLLVITERAYSLQRGHSLGFRGHPEKSTRTLRRQFGLEELEDFPHLQLKLFDAVDEDFVDCWNGRCEAAQGERCSRMDRERALKLWATFQQSEKEINDEIIAAEQAAAAKKRVGGGGGGGGAAEAAPAGGNGVDAAAAAMAAKRNGSVSRSEDERQAEFERQKIQLADHRITAQWLLNRLWNLCLTHGHVDLSPSSTSAASSSSNPVPPPFRLDAALRIARKMLAICHELSQSSMEAHGIGLMEKLYDVAMTLVLLCRDYPALAKQIGLVDLNLKRGARGRDGHEAGGGGALVGPGQAPDSSSASGSRRRVDGQGGSVTVGFDQHVDGEGDGYGGGGGGNAAEDEDTAWMRPSALSPSVPGFYYPLEDDPSSMHGGSTAKGPPSSSGGGPGMAHHPHLSMGAVLQTIPGHTSPVAVKREEPGDGPLMSSHQQGGGASTNGMSATNTNNTKQRVFSGRPLRQAPTAIESILQAYVDIFRAFRAGDHPFLEKMVVAMKELAQGLPRSSGSTLTMAPSAMGSAGAAPMGMPLGSVGRAQGTLASQHSAAHQAGHVAPPPPATGPPSSGAFSTPCPPHPASGASGDAVAAAAAMQRASAYAYTPPSAGMVGSTTLAAAGGGGSGGGPSAAGHRQPGVSGEWASGGVVSPAQTHSLPGTSPAMTTNTTTNKTTGPNGLMMMMPPSLPSFVHASSSSSSSPRPRGSHGAAPSPSALGMAPSAASPTSLGGGGGGAGMEWAQMPEDLGWPSFESFLRECGLWDSVGNPSSSSSSSSAAAATAAAAAGRASAS